MTEFVLGMLAALSVVVGVLVSVVRRQGIELTIIRRWRHDVVSVHQVATGERLACLEMRTGLPVQDELVTKIRRSLEQKGMPS